MEEMRRVLEFLKQSERLKLVLRSSHTSDGRSETVAQHTWRLCLMALVLEDYFPGVEFGRLIRICIVHDLGEALNGDIPAPVQALQGDKSEDERRDLLEILRSLPEPIGEKIVGLWDEYTAAITPEAKIAKALDKLETILQHNQGRNPPGFDYEFNLGYGRAATTGHPAIELMRAFLDEETSARALAAGNR